jgi:hypothetical protein
MLTNHTALRYLVRGHSCKWLKARTYSLVGAALILMAAACTEQSGTAPIRHAGNVNKNFLYLDEGNPCDTDCTLNGNLDIALESDDPVPAGTPDSNGGDASRCRGLTVADESSSSESEQFSEEELYNAYTLLCSTEEARRLSQEAAAAIRQVATGVKNLAPDNRESGESSVSLSGVGLSIDVLAALFISGAGLRDRVTRYLGPALANQIFRQFWEARIEAVLSIRDDISSQRDTGPSD